MTTLQNTQRKLPSDFVKARERFLTRARYKGNLLINVLPHELFYAFQDAHPQVSFNTLFSPIQNGEIAVGGRFTRRLQYVSGQGAFWIDTVSVNLDIELETWALAIFPPEYWLAYCVPFNIVYGQVPDRMVNV